MIDILEEHRIDFADGNDAGGGTPSRSLNSDPRSVIPSRQPENPRLTDASPLSSQTVER
jgi:hypothetical protein